MTLQQRIEAFAKTGAFIKRHFTERNEGEMALHLGLDKVMELAYLHNGWFSLNFVKHAIAGIGAMLDEQDLRNFMKTETAHPKFVAVICAGNIPMVGFHDIMCVLLSGHKLIVKPSSDDDILIPFFLKLLTHFEPELESQINFAAAKMTGFDAVIATGSNNTAGYFEFYFGKYPNIIRKNRTSVAILTGKESKEELKNLGDDIFLYYGLGCRNVSQLFIPRGYDLAQVFENIVQHAYVIDNKKYGNNYDYHRAIYLLEQEKFLDNNFLMMKESDALHSPVGVLFYSQYDSLSEVTEYLKTHTSEIQCVVGKEQIPFGYSQRPVITDFADNIDTREFLLSL